MRALRFFCLSKLNHSVGNGDNSSLFLLILIFLTCCSDFETVESAHSARLIRFSKRQAPPEGCAVAVKLYGAVTDTVLKLGVAAPECESCCYGVTASTHSAIVTAGGGWPGFRKKPIPRRGREPALTSPPLQPLALDPRRSVLSNIDGGNLLLYI